MKNVTATHSTTDHRQDDCRCPDDRCAGPGLHHEVGEPCPCARALDYEAEQVAEFAASLIFVDGGLMEAETRTDADPECDQSVAYKATLNRETRELTFVRSDRLYLTSDYSIPPIGMPRGENEVAIRQHVAESVMGAARSSDVFTFTMPLDAAFDGAREHVVCPDGCQGRECVVNVAMVGIEHSPSEQIFSTGTIKATARTFLHTNYLDYRNDEKVSHSHSVELSSTLTQDRSVTVGGTSDELRALGEYIIAQADRFAAFGTKEVSE